MEKDQLEKIEIDEDFLSSTDVEKGRQLIMSFQDIFSKNDKDVGFSSAVKHRIDMHDSTPIKQRHRRIPPSMYEEVKNHLHTLLDIGIIRPSHSPWSSPIVLARKKNGELRMCVDFREINKRTIRDSYALPRIDDILECLCGAKDFTVLDMKSGYHQIEMEEDHKERTAFTVGPLGFYEYTRTPFGLSNSPATYQRLMEECLGDLHLSICLIYLDDLIIFSDTFEEHIRRLEKVLQRLRECGLKLSPKKCKFFQRRAVYLGHMISEDGISPDPGKIEKVLNWPEPTNPEEVRAFLGFAGYYRKFIRDFAKIARPLNELLPACAKTKTKGKKAKTEASSIWKWNEAEKNSFEKLKKCLSTPPVLGYAQPNLPFELHTDACGQGLGAVLYQRQEEKLRVISFASRGLSKSERNYPTHKLEFLALKWAVTEKFNDYLYGQRFTVFTDNNPLTYVLTSAKLDATGHRWVSALAAFDFDIYYRPGKVNSDADALSRLPITMDAVHAVNQSITSPHTHIESLCSLAQVADVLDDPCVGDIEKMTSKDWRKAQRQDVLLRPWIQLISKYKQPSRRDFPKTKENSQMFKIAKHLNSSPAK